MAQEQSQDSVITYSTSVTGGSEFIDTEEVDHQEEDAVENQKVHERVGNSPTPWYRRKRYWAICTIITVIFIIIFIPILILVIFPAIAQKSINTSEISFEKLLITTPITDQNFSLSTKAHVSGAGPFKATISFDDLVEIWWNSTLLGRVELPTFTVKNGKADLEYNSTFFINDDQVFTDFTKDELNSESFTWEIKGAPTVKAFGVTKKNLKMDKQVTLTGANGYSNSTSVNKFNLTANPNDNSTLFLNISVSLASPSAVGVELGTLGLDLYYLDTYMGQVSSENVTILPGANIFNFSGVAVSQSDNASLTNVGDFFSKFVNGLPINATAKPKYAKPDGTNSIKWLDDALGSVNLSCTVQEPQFNIISGLSLGKMDLQFTSDQPYAPTLTTTDTTVNYSIPFSIPFGIQSVKESMVLYANDTPLAGVTSDWTPASYDSSHIYVNFTSSLVVKDGQQQLFTQFVTGITIGNLVPFHIGGSSGVKASTPIGLVPIDGISVNTTTSVKGASGFNDEPTEISGLDVIGGDQDGLTLSVNASLYNPSDVQIGLGDIKLGFFYQSVQIGEILLPNFTLYRGNNSLSVTAKFRPDSDQGQYVLNAYMNGTGAMLTLSGFPGCASVKSVEPALMALNISSQFPGMKDKLLAGAGLTVLDSTATNGVAASSVILNNPFGAALSISKIESSVSVDGIALGTINVDQSGNPIQVPGKSTQTITLPIQLNLQPVPMFTILRDSAVAQNLPGVNVLDALLAIGKIAVPGADPNVQITPGMFDGFDLGGFVKAALHSLSADIVMTSTVAVGDYTFTLKYQQSNVTATCDDTVVKLIPILGAPIVQGLVNQADLAFSSVMLKDLSDLKFTSEVNGKITGTGPLPATISFSSGVDVVDASSNKALGNMKMPSVKAENNEAVLQLTSEFDVSDTLALADFATRLLGTDSAAWTVSASGLVVNALGVDFPNITFPSKTITLKGSNGFKDQVKVLGFELPGAAPEGGIAIKLKISLFNAGTVGVDAGILKFNAIYENLVIGPADANPAVILPESDNTLELTGRIIPQTDPKGLAVLADLFSAFINGETIVLDTVGVAAVPPSGSCSWLTEAIQKLSIQVTLPSFGKLSLVNSVSMESLDLTFTPDTAYAPITSSDKVVAGFVNPFGFNLDVREIEQNITVVNSNTNMALLTIPLNPASTDQGAKTITTGFKDIPFSVLDGQQSNFNDYVKDLTLGRSKQFTLIGVANVQTTTPSGDVPIRNIEFNVQTTMQGMQGFASAPPEISNVKVTGGTEDGLDIDLDVSITNPSNIKVSVGDVTLDVTYQNTKLGQTTLSSLSLGPGKTTVPAKFVYAPADDAAKALGADLLGFFLENQQSPLTIQGTSKSTPIESLQEAFSQLSLDAKLPGIKGDLIKAISLDMVKLSATITLSNPLDADILVNTFTSDAYLTGTDTKIGSVNAKLPSGQGILVKAHGETKSPPLPITLPTTPTTTTKSKTAKQTSAPDAAQVDGSIGKLPIDIRLTTLTYVGSYPGTINYNQTNILADVVVG